MNRSFRESVVAGSRNNTMGHNQHRRGLSLNGVTNEATNEDNLDLFSKSRRSFSVAAADESDVTVKLGRLSVGSVKLGKTGLDDLLSVADGGKHDYDWLLTPPGTPLVPSSDGKESQSGLMAPRKGPLVRSNSTVKASRFSVSQSESNHSAKPTRSSSVTRSSVSISQYSTYSTKSSSILNTSSSSVSSYIRPSTPTNRSRPSTPSSSSRSTTVSRSSTPSKPRPSYTATSIDKPKSSQHSRPSTPTSSSRPQISAPAARTTTSRPSTPTRRNATTAPVCGPPPSTPGGRNNGRTVSAAVSRPSSPGPRVRPTPQPIVLQDFSSETPPNLRTTLPDRPISAGRSRPGVAITVNRNAEPTTNNVATSPKRQPSPVISRGRLADSAGRNRTLGNGQVSDAIDSRRDSSTRKPLKSSTDSTGFGRTISKKSIDMAVKHMDIRNGSNGFRSLPGSNLFPQSIRPAHQKVPLGSAQNGNYFSESGSEEDKSQSSSKLTHLDIYESSRYDMILLKEDLKNTNWLHSVDDKSDQGSLIFDNGFESLPEPFDPL